MTNSLGARGVKGAVDQVHPGALKARVLVRLTLRPEATPNDSSRVHAWSNTARELRKRVRSSAKKESRSGMAEEREVIERGGRRCSAMMRGTVVSAKSNGARGQP